MNESTSLGNNAATIGTGAILGDSVERDHPSSADSQAETLLKALRNVIVPFIQPAHRTTIDDKLPVGPEGEEFLLVLKKFVASIIQSQSDRKAEITIKLNEWSTNASSTQAGAPMQDKLGHELEDGNKGETQNEDNNSSDITDIGGEDAPDIPEPPRPLTPLDKVREALRHHVFDDMPIRMLSFDTHSFPLTITLVERDTYFAYFLSELETVFDEEEFFLECDTKKRADPSADVERDVVDRWVARISRYAILSHARRRYEGDEVEYDEVNKQTRIAGPTWKPGYNKLYNFCRIAASDYGVTLGWVDTVCIDNRNSAELEEASQFMYKWYQNATSCIVYLSQTVNMADKHQDIWFIHGWPLLVPKSSKFYAKDWKPLVEASSVDLDRSGNIEDASHDQLSKGETLSKTSAHSRLIHRATEDQTEDNNSNRITDSGSEEALSSPEYPLWIAPLERVREALRQHVFNDMPIRMLFFNTLGPQCTITLIEREACFRYLLLKLATKFDEVQFLIRCAVKQHTYRTYAYAEDAVIKEWVENIAGYAILSHTWLRGTSAEVTYDKWSKGGLDKSQPGYLKLVNFCKVAASDHGVTFGWMDTVCINKDSSAELDESIRSMYKWYQKATICITYLAETVDLEDMDKDPWFTRGWTLQELLAPECTKFYSKDWKRLAEASSNDKANCAIQQKIQIATTIEDWELQLPCGGFSTFRKMQWAAMRQVTREEDAAYSMMGLFNVNMSIAYGEGAKQAFSRLLKEILNSSRDYILELFYWTGDYEGLMSTLLPSSPKAYLHASRDLAHLPFRWTPIAPLTITHLGVSIPVLLMPVGILDPYSTTPYHPLGDYHARIPVTLPTYKPDRVTILTLLDLDNIVVGRHVTWDFIGNTRHHTHNRFAIGVLNFKSGSRLDEISIPDECFAVVLKYDAEWETSMEVDEDIIMPLAHTIKVESIKKVSTKEPVVFKLERIGYGSDNLVHKSQLAQHGMLLLNLHL